MDSLPAVLHSCINISTRGKGRQTDPNSWVSGVDWWSCIIHSSVLRVEGLATQTDVCGPEASASLGAC